LPDCNSQHKVGKKIKINKMLNMTAVKTIRMSPDKRNVKYIVENGKGVFLSGDVDHD